MSKTEYDLRRCFSSATNAFKKNILVSLLVVSVLPLPGFLMWTDAPLPILGVELTLLDCFYLGAALLVIYGMFGSTSEHISMPALLSPFFRPVEFSKRCYKFFYSDTNFWKSMYVMILGIIFALGAQWLAGPWKISAQSNLICAGVYTACLLIWSQDLVGWMLAPFYLANHDLPANEAYKRSLFADKENRYWNLRITAVLSLLLPVLLFGILRYVFLRPTDFENYQLNLFLTYILSIVPWLLAMFGLFVWNEIYKQRIGHTNAETAEEPS
ncbi:MAG TPA: hypothetical protein EYN91_09830 [Candidatus Melainabacteria bacterium]|nr:hypothetical protein [Candidatus Melainabacteria bacterium]HIN66244.1 hypothetical protein [Candidatus Obscuribacterales bacterium]